MTNPINYCIQKIKNEIPNEILQIAATEDLGFYNNSITLDEKLLTRVIKAYLLLDINLLTTTTRQITLDKCIVTSYLNNSKQYEYLIEIPDDAVDGKEVTSVSYIMYNMLLPQMGMMTGNAMESAMGTLMQAHSSLNVLTANRIDVVGRNMILVNTGNINWSFMNITMELNISPNPNLSHVKGTAIIELGKLAVLCAKQWIYNSLIIQIDQGYIRGGHSIDAIKNKIESYESAVETYYERLENWPKIGFMLDTRQYQKFIDAQF